MGQDPPAFDILAWNADSTRMPAVMHSFYLRRLYIGNELAKGKPELAGQRLDLAEVKSDSCIVGAVNEHIVPWHASPEQWRSGAVRQDGSWWQDWADWAGRRAGQLVAPPPMGSERFPPIRDAPGRYVRG